MRCTRYTHQCCRRAPGGSLLFRRGQASRLGYNRARIARDLIVPAIQRGRVGQGRAGQPVLASGTVGRGQRPHACFTRRPETSARSRNTAVQSARGCRLMAATWPQASRRRVTSQPAEWNRRSAIPRGSCAALGRQAGPQELCPPDGGPSRAIRQPGRQIRWSCGRRCPSGPEPLSPADRHRPPEREACPCRPSQTRPSHPRGSPQSRPCSVSLSDA